MHPPEWIAEAVTKIHPQARIGWVGEKKRDTDALNQGFFVLIQLFHKRNASKVYAGFPWKEWPSRGPIFGPSYDPLMREPIVLAKLETEDVFSGKVLELLKEWMRPHKEVRQESYKQYANAINSRIDDLSGQSGDRIYHAAQRGYHKPNILANKYLTKEDKMILTGEAADIQRQQIFDHIMSNA